MVKMVARQKAMITKKDEKNWLLSVPKTKRGSNGSHGPRIKKRKSKKGVDRMKFEGVKIYNV